MRVSADELRQHYASLSDEELVAIERDDLGEVARHCYDEEIRRRGLTPSDSRTSEPEPDRGDEPIVVRTFHATGEAKLAQSVLRSANIPCYVEDESSKWDLSGLRLMVPASYFDDARKLLNSEVRADDIEAEPWDGQTHHRFVETNGIRMHYVEAGSGPLVLLCHGFPESWYSWRHQISALAEAGYHVVAPDMRGYGQTDRPAPVEAYDIFQLVGDIVGLINAMDEAPAVIVGHDWGAWITSYASLLRPDLFRAVALLSVPYTPRRAFSQTQWEQQKYPGRVFYQATFRSPQADSVMASDVRGRLLAGLWSASGDARAEWRWKLVSDPANPSPRHAFPTSLPPWLTSKDLDFLESEFKRTGFTGGLNYYRNTDRNWSLTPFLDGAKLLHRTLFIAGEKDAVLEFLDEEYEALDENVPNLWRKELISGAGHWIQQERPAEVNRLLLEFLSEVEAGERAQIS
ncbi:MAG TPA: alpha/beta fold hydrolase [Bryobacteraceae bacterium]|nr:alpha/beta fold hydrolase [Bryobacteraceae bacterium]